MSFILIVNVYGICVKFIQRYLMLFNFFIYKGRMYVVNLYCGLIYIIYIRFLCVIQVFISV